MNPYEELGLDPNGPPEELTPEKITKAYRRAAMKHHPDRNPNDKGAEERFKRAKEAYEKLTNPQPERAAAASSRGAQAGGFSGSGFNVDDLFAQMFGGGRGANGSGSRASWSGWDEEAGDVFSRGADIEGRIQIPLRRALAGGRFTVSITRANGKEEQVDLNLRPGIADGERVVAAGKGSASPTGKGEAGDLVLTIQVQADPVFERSGDDLSRPLQVPFARCALGGDVAVEMPDGSWVNVAVPQGASAGMKLRLRGKGAANARGGHGDLYCRIEPIAPKKMLAKERKVWERLLALQEAADQAKD